MDQIKPFLQGIVKYRFWLVCGIVTPLLAGGWWTTVADLRSDTETLTGEIEGSYSTVSSVMGKVNHPNDLSLEGIDQYIAQLTDEVLNAWEHMYKQQEDILVWPEDLGDEFISKVEKLKPVEVVPFPTPPEDEILRHLREQYRDYIKEELPKLAQIIDAEWKPGTGGGGGGGMMAAMMGGGEDYGGFGGEEMMGMEMMGMGGMGMGGMGMGGMGGMGMDMMGTGTRPPEVKFTVLWDSSDQSNLQNTRFDWSRLPDKAPRTLDILYAQEDLWVLKGLMDVIARTNYDATGQYNATIKEIKFISLGRTVGRSSGKVARVTAGGGGMMGEYMMMEGDEGMDASIADLLGGGDGDMMAAMMGVGEDGEMGMGTTATATDPAQNRYVDNDYQPVDATTLREALTSENRDPANAYLVVAKRMPVRMSLVMDQRRIPRLITACGNASLMVEIRQVRVNKESSRGMMGGGMGGMMGGMMGMGGMGGMDEEPAGEDEAMAMYGMMGGGGAMGGLPTSSGKASYDVPVEVYGMIYIYNPVDTDKLGIEKVEAGANPLESGTDPAVPEDAAPPLTVEPSATPAAPTEPAEQPAADSDPAPASAPTTAP